MDRSNNVMYEIRFGLYPDYTISNDAKKLDNLFKLITNPLKKNYPSAIAIKIRQGQFGFFIPENAQAAFNEEFEILLEQDLSHEKLEEKREELRLRHNGKRYDNTTIKTIFGFEFEAVEDINEFQSICEGYNVELVNILNQTLTQFNPDYQNFNSYEYLGDGLTSVTRFQQRYGKLCPEYFSNVPTIVLPPKIEDKELMFKADLASYLWVHEKLFYINLNPELKSFKTSSDFITKIKSEFGNAFMTERFIIDSTLEIITKEGYDEKEEELDELLETFPEDSEVIQTVTKELEELHKCFGIDLRIGMVLENMDPKDPISDFRKLEEKIENAVKTVVNEFEGSSYVPTGQGFWKEDEYIENHKLFSECEILDD